MFTKATALIAIRRRLVGSPADSGVSIIEALVAILVFALIAIGVAQGTMLASRTAIDAQHRTVALNLTAAQLDYVRSQNAYAVSSTTFAAPSSVTTIDGTTYTTYQTVRPVNQNGADQSCGAVTGRFQLFRVRVRTDWTGQLPGTATAVSNGLLTPDATLKSPGNGAIFVQVNKSNVSSGAPYANLAVTVTDSDGDTVPAPNTNSDGCSYISDLVPGNYTVTLNTAGNIDSKQNQPSVSQTLTVTAGSAVPWTFSYDQAANLQMTYGPNVSNVYQATDMAVSLFTPGSTPPYIVKTGNPTTIPVYPDTAGYALIAGKPVPVNGTNPTCLSPDADNWPAGLSGLTSMKAGDRMDPVAASPATSPSVRVPMGLAKVALPDSGHTYYVIVSNSTSLGAGDPGCQVPQRYVYTVVRNNNPTIALPYGTWNVGYSTVSTSTTPAAALAQVTTNASAALVPSTTITVDPRAAA